MGIRATVSPCFGNKADGSRPLYPLLWRKRETVCSGFRFKGIEFDAFKLWVVDTFPDTSTSDTVIFLTEAISFIFRLCFYCLKVVLFLDNPSPPHTNLSKNALVL